MTRRLARPSTGAAASRSASSEKLTTALVVGATSLPATIVALIVLFEVFCPVDEGVVGISFALEREGVETGTRDRSGSAAKEEWVASRIAKATIVNRLREVDFIV